VEEKRALSPKRFRFCEVACVREHKNREQHIVGLKFPSLKRLFLAETGITTYDGPYGPYRFLTDPKQIEAALEWQERYSSLIFLRDNLDCSVAVDFNLASPGVYTKLGQAEHDAKASRKFSAIKELTSASADTIQRVLFYRECDAICAVPPAQGKEWDLPTELAKYVATKTGKENLSPSVKFLKKKESVKSLSLDDKWKMLENAGLRTSSTFKGKKVILLDDKYQSGTTAQFVASRLYDAGAAEVHGLFCVKTWRDTDNT
jgi:predicted amidophosphoribosyltransferase